MNILDKWEKNGYLILENFFESNVLDELNFQIEDLWRNPSNHPEFKLCGFVRNDHEQYDIDREEYLKLDKGYRESLIKNNHWRVHEMFKHLPAAKSIAEN